MKSLDDIEQELDKHNNKLIGELWNEVNSVIREMEDFHSFLAMWQKIIEENGFKIEKIETKLKGKEEWDGDQY